MQDCKIARHTTKSTKSTKLKIKYTLYSTVNPDTDKRTKPIFNLDKEALYNFFTLNNHFKNHLLSVVRLSG